MTPAELNHWAAEFMGWNILHRNPCESHDDCQRVIEKAIDRGMDLRTFALELSGRNASMYDIGRIILATPEQKLRAVHAAWMEKKSNV